MSTTEKNAEAIGGIQKQTKSREQLERQMREFLDEASSKPGNITMPGCPLNHGLACVLATVHDNIPRATPVDFFSDGLTIWIAGEPGSENPQHPVKSQCGSRYFTIPWTTANSTAACKYREQQPFSTVPAIKRKSWRGPSSLASSRRLKR